MAKQNPKNNLAELAHAIENKPSPLVVQKVTPIKAKEPTVRLSVTLSKSNYVALRKIAYEYSISKRAILEQAFSEYLAKRA